MPTRYNPDKYHRRSIRLKGYDYTTAGAYFITLCTHQRECLFGAIEHGEMRLSQPGQIVVDTYLWLANQYPYVHLDRWVVMPNHLHGIIVLTDDCRGGLRIALPPNLAPPPNIAPDIALTPDVVLTPDITLRKPLGRLIGAFKTVSTKQINLVRDTPDIPVWQRNYYEHIIRDDRALQHIRQYIQNNPLSWRDDQLHPDHPPEW